MPCLANKPRPTCIGNKQMQHCLRPVLAQQHCLRSCATGRAAHTALLHHARGLRTLIRGRRPRSRCPDGASSASDLFTEACLLTLLPAILDLALASRSRSNCLKAPLPAKLQTDLTDGLQDKTHKHSIHHIHLPQGNHFGSRPGNGHGNGNGHGK